jgi:hypothetical protein
VVPRGELTGAWPPRGVRGLARSERRAGMALAGRAGFGCGPRKEGRGPEGEKSIFKFPFSMNFQIIVFKSHFEQEYNLF